MNKGFSGTIPPDFSLAALSVKDEVAPAARPLSVLAAHGTWRQGADPVTETLRKLPFTAVHISCANRSLA